MEKLTIGFDIDEVIARTNMHVMAWHNEKYGTNFKRNDIKKYEFSHLWGGTVNDVIRKFYEFYDTKYFDMIQPVKGAREVIQRLSQSYNVVLVTARQLEIKEKTLNWIEKYFPGQFTPDRIILSDMFTLGNGKKRQKSEICIEHKIRILVEDRAETLEECAKKGIAGIIMTTPWNKNYDLSDNPLIRRADSIYKVEKRVKKLHYLLENSQPQLS